MDANKLLPKGWKRLKRHERIKRGDHPVYTDGTLNRTPVSTAEVGMTVAASGYFGMARRVEKGARLPRRHPMDLLIQSIP
jgi:hypothetical protein